MAKPASRASPCTRGSPLTIAVLFRLERLYCWSSRRLSGLSSTRAWLGKMKTRSDSSPAARIRSTSSVISSSGSTYTIFAMGQTFIARMIRRITPPRGWSSSSSSWMAW